LNSTYCSEAVNAIALGKTRAKQYSLLKQSPKDCSLGDKVMCVQLHGDASFSGQGVVMESLGLSMYFPNQFISIF
jgi:probable 2-oxoglutarate dehydrogenase E1 component DHKTD1